MTPNTPSTITVPTAEGRCPVWLHAAADEAPLLPAVILYMDAPGIRPALHAIATRLAAASYLVALPDLFYRSGPYAPVDSRQVFTDPDHRAAHRARFNALLTTDGAMADTREVIDAVRALAAAAPGANGVVGYCMGGRLALTTAGTFSTEIAVAAAFHAGRLADDAPSSPHRLASRIAAEVFVPGATGDANFPDTQKARLTAALRDAGVVHRIETWPARHGWVPCDTAAHDPEQAERHWSVLVPLLNRVLKLR